MIQTRLQDLEVFGKVIREVMDLGIGTVMELNNISGVDRLMQSEMHGRCIAMPHITHRLGVVCMVEHFLDIAQQRIHSQIFVVFLVDRQLGHHVHPRINIQTHLVLRGVEVNTTTKEG